MHFYWTLLYYSDREVQIFSQFSGLFDTAVKNMAKMAADQTTKCQNHYKREFSNIGKCFTGLGQAMEQDGGGYNPGQSCNEYSSKIFGKHWLILDSLFCSFFWGVWVYDTQIYMALCSQLVWGGPLDTVTRPCVVDDWYIFPTYNTSVT